MVYYGFGVYSPCSLNPYLQDEFRKLADRKGMSWKYFLIEEIKKGTPVSEAVDEYMAMRRLGTDDRDELVKEFTKLSQLSDKKISEKHTHCINEVKISEFVLFGRE